MTFWVRSSWRSVELASRASATCAAPSSPMRQVARSRESSAELARNISASSSQLSSVRSLRDRSRCVSVELAASAQQISSTTSSSRLLAPSSSHSSTGCTCSAEASFLAPALTALPPRVSLRMPWFFMRPWLSATTPLSVRRLESSSSVRSVQFLAIASPRRSAPAIWHRFPVRLRWRSEAFSARPSASAIMPWLSMPLKRRSRLVMVLLRRRSLPTSGAPTAPISLYRMSRDSRGTVPGSRSSRRAAMPSWRTVLEASASSRSCLAPASTEARTATPSSSM
mmetsp:Transcript_9617/g.26151  ORF Transcript_9617/g.26151 Transcript_9617/m.26151 type:complete len:282 (-) Transcript_9617:203-1048(-)